MYNELGADRSFAKLIPLVKERFGGPSQRVIQGWSAKEHWPEQARQFDAARAETLLARAEEVIASADVDEAETLHQIARQHLRDIANKTLSLAERKIAMGIAESALRALGELTGSARRRPSLVQNNNTLIVGEGGPARRALDALGARMHAISARPELAPAPTPATAPAAPPIEPKGAGRILDLDEAQRIADVTGRDFEDVLRDWDTAAAPLPAVAPATAPEMIFVNVHDLARDATVTRRSFAELIEARRQT